MSLEKRKPIRSEAILKSAEGESCTICGKNDGTTVFCHLNESWAGKGMGQKADDIAGFFGCNECHDLYDQRSSNLYNHSQYEIMRAMYRTWVSLIAKGIITIKDAK